MPQVQFARADLPWLFTPAAPGHDAGRGCGRGSCSSRSGAATRPAAARRAAPGAGARRPGRRELPDLAQSWAWAHAQITGLAAGARPADVLAADPGRACSRLVCAAQACEPGTAYLACLVPAFAVGVQAGLGQPVPDRRGAASTRPGARRRRPAAAAGLRLAGSSPRGPTGSFETLVRTPASERRSTPPRRARRTSTWARPAAACRPAG